jgi:DNA polymerase I-like protein with 3'-5' exonuclease and polymerase domains
VGPTVARQPIDPRDIIGLDSEYDRESGFYLACARFDNEHLTFKDRESTIDFVKWCERGSRVLALHNARSDFNALGYYPTECRLLDTLVLSWLNNENEAHGLKVLTPRYLGRDLEDPIKVRDGKVYWFNYKTRLHEAPIEEVEAYCADDARATRDLALLALKDWDIPWDWYWDYEVPLDHVLYDMERAGIRLDTDRLLQETYTLSRERAAHRARVFEQVGYQFNLNSGKQLANVLFHKKWNDKVRGTVGTFKTCLHGKDPERCAEGGYVRATKKQEGRASVCVGRPKEGWVDLERKGLGLKARKRTETGLLSTDDEALEPHSDHPTVATLLDFRAADKVVGTYLEAFPRFMKGDRLYGHFNRTGTKTGRLSSSDPNLQNVPARGDLGKRVRRLFIPSEGMVFVQADLDQIELRLLAAFAKDPALLQAFRNGEDPHGKTADLMAVERLLAKNINYSMAYGGSARTIQRKYARNQPLEVIEAALSRHRAAFPHIYAWKERVLDFAKRNGFVYTVARRKRRLPDIYDFNVKRRAAAERQAVNVAIQGSAADLMNVATVLMAQQGVPLLLQVHDEVVAECPPEQAEAVALQLTAAFQLAASHLSIDPTIISVTPKVVTDWGQAKE